MKKLAHDLSLHAMISRVLQDSTEKLAEDEGSKDQLKKLVGYGTAGQGGQSDQAPAVAGAAPKPASDWTNPDYIEKLASSLEFIGTNFQEIAPPTPKGPLAQAVEKVAGESKGVSPAVNVKGSVLQASKGIGGKQAYTHEKPAGEDAAASEAHAKETKGGLPGAATQVANNFSKAPGQSSGSVPHAEYPEKGPLVNKHASMRDFYIASLTKQAEFPPSASSEKTEKTEKTGKTEKSAKTGKTKTASELARESILMKLAGEDVMKANISASRDHSPLVGGGVLSVHDAESLPKQKGDSTDGSFGNANRKHLASNKAAIDMTKRDAKKDMVPQLGQVLDTPAFSPKHDNKLNENLRNTGEAGVKIAAERALLEKIASGGCTCGGASECQYCHIKTAMSARVSGKTGATTKTETTGSSSKTGKTKTANSMAGYPSAGLPGVGGAGGGGMASTADAGVAPDGCACGHSGECRVCKLQAALAQAKAEAHGGGAAGGGSVEKDSEMGSAMSSMPGGM